MEKENKAKYSIEKSVFLAGKAFLKDDYKAVIYWLRPHLHDLCPLQRKKLLFAIKSFHGDIAEASIFWKIWYPHRVSVVRITAVAVRHRKRQIQSNEI
jgi:hypothetical protein